MKGPRNRKPAPPSDERVVTVKIEGRRVTIIRIDAVRPGLELKGALVWVRPKKETSPEELAAAIALVKKAGAARVLPMPLEAGDAAVPASAIERPAPAASKVREIVAAMLGELKEMKEEVTEIVEAAMAEAKL
jgi:hypothetical protein